MDIPANHKTVIEFMNLCTIQSNILTSPTVWGITQGAHAKYIQWNIYISINEPLTPDMIINRSNTKSAIYWTVFGHQNGVLTKSSETVIEHGKNIGKLNFTTPLTQAILMARSIFNKKLREGGSLNKSSLYMPGSNISFRQLVNNGLHEWRVFPMALHDINKSNNWKHINFPAMIQPKYDGTRFVVVNYGSIDNPKLDGYSRGQKEYGGQDHILKSLQTINLSPGLYLDGELYLDGMNLQNISGNSRRSDSDIKLDFYIFDCFKVDEPNMIFMDRAKLLRSILKPLPDHIKIVPTKSVESKADVMNIFSLHMKSGYEGSVIRNKDSIYEFGINSEKRSYTTLKIKPFNDDEWILCGFKRGIGKDADAIIWILTVTPDTISKHSKKYNMPNIKLPGESDQKFDAVSKGIMGTLDARRKLFTFLSKDNYFEKYLQGQEMTIQFSILSDYGKPQQPKVLGFRNKKIQNQLLHDAGIS